MHIRSFSLMIVQSDFQANLVYNLCLYLRNIQSSAKRMQRQTTQVKRQANRSAHRRSVCSVV